MANSISELIGAYDLVADFDADPTGVRASDANINAAMQEIASIGGCLISRGGTFLLNNPIVGYSNIMVLSLGAKSRWKLNTGRNCDILQLSNVTGFRMDNVVLDGNRTNNTSGNGTGIYLLNVSDSYFDNIEVVSCRGDGWSHNQSLRIEMKGCRASDNGRHGISLNGTTFCLLISPHAFDNCQVASAGNGDGINLDVISQDNTIIAPLCYESDLVGSRQGYGVREVAGSLCARNLIIGGSFRGNRTGSILLEPDSMAITYPLTQVPAGLSITP